MSDTSNAPVAVRAEDQPLIKAIDDARRQRQFSDGAATQLLDDFTKPPRALGGWIVDLCDPSPRASPFMTDDDLAAFTRDVSGQDCSARWADLTTRERRLARRINHFAQDKRRVWMGAGPPRNVDPALVLYVIRRLEEAIGVPFRFARPKPFCLGGPVLRLAEAALVRLFHLADRTDPRRSRVLGYLGWVSPAPHYTRWEIARTVQLARRASRTSPGSPANWRSDLILAFPNDVRSELVGKARRKNKGKARRKNKDKGIAPLSSGDPVRWLGFVREVLEAALAAGREQRISTAAGSMPCRPI